METPTPEDVRRALAPLDSRCQKIVIGLLSVMINDPPRVREREWIAERLTELTLLAGGFEDDTPEGSVRAVEEFLKGSSEELVRAAYLLFQRVGLDLAPRAAAGFTFEEAVKCGLAYLPGAPDTGHDSRDLGEQPLAHLMAEHHLKPKDLVAASTEQLTFRMVTRAMKGRRLTANTMAKVQRAWNLATSGQQAQAELFNYRA